MLGVLYPMAIVLIALSFFQRWLAGRRWVYPVAVLFTGVFSVLFAGTMIPSQVLQIPMYEVYYTLNWIDTFWPFIVPSFFGGGIPVDGVPWSVLSVV